MMLPHLFAQIFDDDVITSVFKAVMSVVLTGLSFAAFVGEMYAVYFLFSLPMRRVERARLFLDLLEDALQRGQPVEEMILSVAASRDRTTGVRFHLLAAHLQNGLRLGEALKKVPRFLPPQIMAMLQAGERLGDLKKVLPASREILRERPAAVRSAVHYLIVVVLFFSPVFILVTGAVMIFVIPKFKDVAAGMGVQLWPVSLFVFAVQNWLIEAEVLFTLLIMMVTVFYIGGPQLARLFQADGFPLVDWISWRIPWKHKRLQRTFSAMLAVLLDGGVPEVEAVRLAEDCTANVICRRRAARIMGELARGVKLEEAVRAFDDRGEFRWRLANAFHGRGGFLEALRGWHESLDAKAFQQEEASAQALTTGVVILNGAFVALIAIGMFGILMAVLNAMVFP